MHARGAGAGEMHSGGAGESDEEHDAPARHETDPRDVVGQDARACGSCGGYTHGMASFTGAFRELMDQPNLKRRAKKLKKAAQAGVHHVAAKIADKSGKKKTAAADPAHEHDEQRPGRGVTKGAEAYTPGCGGYGPYANAPPPREYYSAPPPWHAPDAGPYYPAPAPREYYAAPPPWHPPDAGPYYPAPPPRECTYDAYGRIVCC